MLNITISREKIYIIDRVLKEIYKNDKLELIKIHNIIKNNSTQKWGSLKEWTETMNEVTIEELIAVLTNSYKVEKTVEEKILDRYLASLFFAETDSFHRGFAKGMEYILNINNQKIDGIN